MNTKVIMIYPEAPSTYWGLKYVLPFVGKKSAYPPSVYKQWRLCCRTTIR